MEEILGCHPRCYFSTKNDKGEQTAKMHKMWLCLWSSEGTLAIICLVEGLSSLYPTQGLWGTQGHPFRKLRCGPMLISNGDAVWGRTEDSGVPGNKRLESFLPGKINIHVGQSIILSPVVGRETQCSSPNCHLNGIPMSPCRPLFCGKLSVQLFNGQVCYQQVVYSPWAVH